MNKKTVFSFVGLGISSFLILLFSNVQHNINSQFYNEKKIEDLKNIKSNLIKDNDELERKFVLLNDKNKEISVNNNKLLNENSVLENKIKNNGTLLINLNEEINKKTDQVKDFNIRSIENNSNVENENIGNENLELKSEINKSIEVNEKNVGNVFLLFICCLCVTLFLTVFLRV